ncbi:putative MFS family arabinose efflux permease [Micromonospora sp. Llam0]|uniref:MFS transporter n=1 Tax=Micromonospora sp. Llam0 TaxID=2485143 RepID=UPI000FAAD0A1|nr:MFS transporter [Micromonospora sp. Llam0]ROO60683.1 putative MFS family arabinose efflux permease [Micromonospora sp. Llam0]
MTVTDQDPGRTGSGMRHFRFLVVGNAVSAYGTYLDMIALSLFAYSLTGSATHTGLFMALRLATSVLTGFGAGSLVSRLDRKRLMVTSDVSQAVALVVLVIAPTTAQAGLLYAVAVVTGAGATVTSVALRSSIPEIVGQDQRVRANALLATGRSLAMVAGFASAGVLISTVGYTGAFLIDAGAFLFSAAVLARLPITTRSRQPVSATGTETDPGPGTAAGPEPDDARRRPGILAAQLTALRYLRLTPVLLALISLRAVDAFGSASHNVGLPVLSTMLDPQHPAAFMSQFWATWAIGNIIAQRGVARWARRTGRTINERAFAAGAALMSVAFILTFTAPPLPLAVLVATVAGVADGFTEIAYTTRLQATPDDQRGYVFGFSATAENLGFGVGMVACSFLLEQFSPLTVVTLFHGLAVLLAVAFLATLWARRRTTT